MKPKSEMCPLFTFPQLGGKVKRKASYGLETGQSWDQAKTKWSLFPLFSLLSSKSLLSSATEETPPNAWVVTWISLGARLHLPHLRFLLHVYGHRYHHVYELGVLRPVPPQGLWAWSPCTFNYNSQRAWILNGVVWRMGDRIKGRTLSFFPDL